jgi:glucose-1-phosphate thymidylyltransferase
MKGIILAGGKGTRLRPATQIYNKHLLAILNKPMVLYPLETLKKLGIKDILIVTGGDAVGGFADFLGDGSDYGVNLTYKVQKEAGGIAQALGLAQDFAKDSQSIAVVLGDNIFDNNSVIIPKNYKENYAVLFGKKVKDPERFGVMEITKNGKVTSIEEKPKNPKSNIAVTGLYIYPQDVFDIIKTLKPSARGELEITDVNNYYIKRDNCLFVNLKGFWHDAGTPSSLFEAIKWAYENSNLW